MLNSRTFCLVLGSLHDSGNTLFVLDLLVLKSVTLHPMTPPVKLWVGGDGGPEPYFPTRPYKTAQGKYSTFHQ